MLTYAQTYTTRNQKKMHNLRSKLAVDAKKYSIREATRIHNASRNTVRLWSRRAAENPTGKLIDRRPATTNHPERMDPESERKLVDEATIRKQRGQRIIVAILVKRLRIPYSVKTAIKCLRRNDLYPAGRVKKEEEKQDLRAVSDAMDFGECIHTDVKYLTDIVELKEAIGRGDAPRYAFIARDRATGAAWTSYANEKSTTNAALFADYVLSHLVRNGVDMTRMTFQTDNGSEFVVNWRDAFKYHVVPTNNRALRRIPPAHPAGVAYLQQHGGGVQSTVGGRMLRKHVATELG